MRKHIIASLIISILIFVIGTVAIQGYISKRIAIVKLGNEYTMVAGVIRNNGNGWNLIQDATHETVGITTVKQDNEKIIVKYNSTKVNALTATVDETMASEGYRVGASVGIDQTFIFIYDKDNKLVNPNDYVNNKGNIWVQGVFKK